MSTSVLSKREEDLEADREAGICRRLRDGRVLAGISQKDCAHLLGVPIATWVNYEFGRVQLRWNLALRYCRLLLISEEFLAVGNSFPAMRLAAAANKVKLGADLRPFEPIFSRQCMDLLSDKISVHVPTGLRLSSAWDVILAKRYLELVTKHFFYPRIIFSEVPEVDLMSRFLTVQTQRYQLMLGWKATKLKKDPWTAQRQFGRALFLANGHIFKKFMDVESDQEELEILAWLRDSLDPKNPKYPIGPLHDTTAPVGKGTFPEPFQIAVTN